ncbi:MAG: Xaa-Pro peptidase family protein, partial [Candidatus Diapherotrites archaeon]|nr:Xaa-Pro peptidase family protein [Candidatus Diapherotrites archaeon]
DGFDSNLLILTKNKKPSLITSDLDHGTVSKMKEFSVHNVKTKKEFDIFLKNNLQGNSIGLDLNAFSVNEFARFRKWFKGKKLMDVSKELRELRNIKTKKELKFIQKACRITENALAQVPELFKKGMTEKNLGLELECIMRSKGADSALAYPSIIASQGNAGIPHHVTGDKKISSGWLLLDVGCRYKNYCSDLSRTFFVGKSTEHDRSLYNLVFHAKESAEKYLKENAIAKDLYFQAETVLQEKKWNMKHSLGHGVGLEVHDTPDRMGPDSNWKLKTGMVVTIEPGIYWNTGGIRLEDTHAVLKNGFKKLCKNASNELIEI